MAAGIDDVARRAGVSVATVSRALRGLPHVAPATRERVLAAAAALDYVADPHASRLAARRSATVGLVLPVLGQWYYARLFAGVERVLHAANYDVLPYTVPDHAARREFLAALPFRKRVDALIVVDVPFSAEAWRELAAAQVAVVSLGIRRASGVRLTIDNPGAAGLATEHLLAHGHRRIGMLSTAEDDPGHVLAPVEREAGHRTALAAWGVAHDPALVVRGDPSLAGGADAAQRLLALPNPPTAVFALSDEMAIGALKVARDAGLPVPGALSVVGFDDHDVAEYMGLTTVRQDVVVHGEMVAREVLALLGSGVATAAVDRPLHLPTRLVVRASTGPAAARVRPPVA
jgi:LacI family repressor for deo operon, udp, cdd, tsx, nupC, and nupG